MELAAEVDRYLRQTGMSASRFGRLVARDPSLVADLRAGRRPRARLYARILVQLGRPLDLPGQFLRALAGLADDHGYGLTSPEALAWACSGFVGEQMCCELRPGMHADRGWPLRLPGYEWRLPFLVADLEVSPRDDGFAVTALLLPEA